MIYSQIYTVGPNGTKLQMWATTGNHGHQWTYANVILSHTAPFRVTFQGEVGGDMWTNIALDDISFTPECAAGGLCVSLYPWFLLIPLSFPLFPHLFWPLMLLLLLAPFI